MSRSLEPAAEAVPDCEPRGSRVRRSQRLGSPFPRSAPRLLEYISRSLRWRDVGGSHPEIAGIDQHPAIEIRHAGPSSVRKQEGDPPPLRRAG